MDDVPPSEGGAGHDRYLSAEAHRLSNIVQIMAALLADRRRHLKDPVAREQIEWAEQNLRALMLLATPPDGRPDTGFGEQFAIQMSSWREILAARSIELEVDAQEFKIPSGLETTLIVIANELLTNALKYAFGDGERGRVRVSLRKLGGERAELLVADNGRGMPPDAPPSGLGLGLLERLSGRIGGTLSLESKGGLTTRLRFPLS